MHKILVVDDDKDLLEMVCIFLEGQGMQVQYISENFSVKEQLSNFKPDIILMDIYLGSDDGREICSELKKSPYSHIPVLLYSAGNISASSLHKSMADDFLVKPFNLKTLINTINSHIAKTQL